MAERLEMPFKAFVEIQNMQFKLDDLNKKAKKISAEIRSIKQTMPKLIKAVPLQ